MLLSEISWILEVAGKKTLRKVDKKSLWKWIYWFLPQLTLDWKVIITHVQIVYVTIFSNRKWHHRVMHDWMRTTKTNRSYSQDGWKHSCHNMRQYSIKLCSSVTCGLIRVGENFFFLSDIGSDRKCGFLWPMAFVSVDHFFAILYITCQILFFIQNWMQDYL